MTARSKPDLDEPVTTGATGTGSVVSADGVEAGAAPRRRLTVGLLAGVLLGGAVVFLLVRGGEPTVEPPIEAAGPGSVDRAEPGSDDSGDRPVATATPAGSGMDAPEVDEPDAGVAPAPTGGATIRRPVVSTPDGHAAKKGGGKKSGSAADFLPSEL